MLGSSPRIRQSASVGLLEGLLGAAPLETARCTSTAELSGSMLAHESSPKEDWFPSVNQAIICCHQNNSVGLISQFFDNKGYSHSSSPSSDGGDVCRPWPIRTFHMRIGIFCGS